MTTRKKSAAVPSDVLAAARERAKKTREEFENKRDASEILTPQELADGAPFYFVLRNYVIQLKKAREAAGLTLAEFAKRTGLAVETISRIDTGALPNPTWKTLGVYAAALGMRPILTLDAADDKPEKLRDGNHHSPPLCRIGESAHLEVGNHLIDEHGATTWDRPALEKLRIPPYIYLDPPDGFGFPQFRVFEVLAGPTDTEILKIDDFDAIILAKATPTYADVVCVEDVAEGKHKVVAFAFRAFSDLSDTPPNKLRALDIVKLMTGRFGVPICIGIHEGKFFLESTFEKPSIEIPGRNPNAPIHFAVPYGRAVIAGTAIKVDKDTNKIRIALAFGFDSTSYQEWLASHKVQDGS
jgi:transcriptional regulator with XRE-family HTH domain